MFDLKTFKEGVAKVLNIQTAQSQMKDAAEAIEALTTENAALKEKSLEYEKTIAGYPAAKQEMEASVEKLKTEHASAIEALKAEHATKVDALNKTISEEKLAVTNEVTKELSAIGVPEGAIKEDKPDKLSHDSAKIMEQIKALRTKGSHKEADALYRKNRSLFVK